jgi:hypothetical protein
MWSWAWGVSSMNNLPENSCLLRLGRNCCTAAGKRGLSYTKIVRITGLRINEGQPYVCSLYEVCVLTAMTLSHPFYYEKLSGHCLLLFIQQTVWLDPLCRLLCRQHSGLELCKYVVRISAIVRGNMTFHFAPAISHSKRGFQYCCAWLYPYRNLFLRSVNILGIMTIAEPT